VPERVPIDTARRREIRRVILVGSFELVKEREETALYEIIMPDVVPSRFGKSSH
jgi:hypothetical protein